MLTPAELWNTPTVLALPFLGVLLMLLVRAFAPMRFNGAILRNLGLSQLAVPFLVCDFSGVGLDSSVNLLLYVLVYDLGYYWMHRSLHRLRRVHFLHHRRLSNPMQCLDFHALEFGLNLLLLVAVGQLFPLTLVELTGWLCSYFALQLVLHTGWDLRWPVLINPAEHALHHGRHHDANFASVFKAIDRLFGTYRAPPRGPRPPSPSSRPEVKRPPRKRPRAPA